MKTACTVLRGLFKEPEPFDFKAENPLGYIRPQQWILNNPKKFRAGWYATVALSFALGIFAACRDNGADNLVPCGDQQTIENQTRSARAVDAHAARVIQSSASSEPQLTISHER